MSRTRIDPGAEIMRARDKIERSRQLLKREFFELSMQQSYLAMFAIGRARAAVEEPSFSDRGHDQLFSRLRSIYRDDRTGANPGKVLQRAFQWKQMDDYGVSGGMPANATREEAAEAHHIAIDFVGRMTNDIVGHLGHVPEPIISEDQQEAVHREISSRDPRGRGPADDSGIV